MIFALKYDTMSHSSFVAQEWFLNSFVNHTMDNDSVAKKRIIGGGSESTVPDNVNLGIRRRPLAVTFMLK